MHDELVAQVEREVISWPGVEKELRWFDLTGGDAKPVVANVTIYTLGRRQLGHIHHEGVADLQFPKTVHDELIAAGRANPHTGGFPAVVSHDLRRPEDVPEVVALFRLSYERAKAAADQRASSAAAD